MNKTGKMMILGLILATGISNVAHSWWGGWRGRGGWGWRGRRPVAGLRNWRVRNNSGSVLKITNNVGNSLELQPRTDGLLPRSGAFTLFVEDLSTGQQKEFRTTDGVVIFYHDSSGNLRIVTRGRWDSGIGWGFGPFAVGVGFGLGRGWGRRGWWGRRRGPYWKRGHRGHWRRGHHRGMHGRGRRGRRRRRP